MKHTTKRTKNAGKARKATTRRTARVAPALPRSDARRAPAAAPTPSARPRDPRIPAAGTTLTRPYKGREYRVEVLEDGFRYEGQAFRSLSALASHVTGFKSVNGVLWFGLAARPGATRRAGTAPVAEGAQEPVTA